MGCITTEVQVQILLVICDIQILTGTGILFSAYINVFHFCYLSAYHWQLVVYLAWFSNLTHMACLAAMRGYLHRNPRERNLRLVFMTVLWLGLLVAIVPTMFFNWTARERAGRPTAALPASNARCYFNLETAWKRHDEAGCLPDVDHCASAGPVTVSFAFQSGIVTILLSVFSYCTRLVKMTKLLSEGLRFHLRKKVSSWVTRGLARLHTTLRIDVASPSPTMVWWYTVCFILCFFYCVQHPPSAGARELRR